MNSEYGVYHNGKKTEQKRMDQKTGDFFFRCRLLLFLKRERTVGGDQKRSDSERTWFRGLSGKKRVSEIFEKYTAENGDM